MERTKLSSSEVRNAGREFCRTFSSILMVEYLENSHLYGSKKMNDYTMYLLPTKAGDSIDWFADKVEENDGVALALLITEDGRDILARQSEAMISCFDKDSLAYIGLICSETILDAKGRKVILEQFKRTFSKFGNYIGVLT